jgi:hypothetical protein
MPGMDTYTQGALVRAMQSTESDVAGIAKKITREIDESAAAR